MQWPARHVRAIGAYLTIEPTAEERTVFSIAQLTAYVVNYMKGKEQARSKTMDFVLFADAWKEKTADPSGRYSESDVLMLQALANVRKRPK